MKLMNNFKFFAADVGNSATKYAYFRGNGIHYGIVPNVVGPAIKLDSEPAGRIEDCLSVQVLSADEEFRGPKFVGNLAKLQLQELAFQDRDRDKANSEGLNILFPTVLCMNDTTEDVVAGVGATLTDFAEQSPLLQKKLTKQHAVKFEYGSRAKDVVKVNVIQVEAYPQCAAGLYGMAKNDDGSISRTDWNDKTVLGLDFGHGQINVAILQNLQPIKRACFSLDYGFYRVVAAVQNYLNGAPYYVTASIPQLQRSVEEGYYWKHGKRIDIGAPINSACEQIIDLIYNEIANNQERVSKMLFDSISEVVVMGGGAKTFAPYIGSKFDLRPEVASNSIYANVRGLLLRTKARWVAEHAMARV